MTEKKTRLTVEERDKLVDMLLSIGANLFKAADDNGLEVLHIVGGVPTDDRPADWKVLAREQDYTK